MILKSGIVLHYKNKFNCIATVEIVPTISDDKAKAENALSDDVQAGGVANHNLATPERIGSLVASFFEHAKVSVLPPFLGLLIGGFPSA